MTSILESLAGTIYGATAGLFFDAVLTRTSVASQTDSYDPNTGSSSTTSYACKAIHEEFSVGYHQRGLVDVGDFKFLILAYGLSVEPQPGDYVSIPSRGVAGTIVPEGSGMKAVTTDPAKAVWTCRCRK